MIYFLVEAVFQALKADLLTACKEKIRSVNSGLNLQLNSNLNNYSPNLILTPKEVLNIQLRISVGGLES